MDTMIGRIEATPGNRDALADALVHDVDEMPGCLTYLIAIDPGDANGVWVAESWASEEAHAAWLASDATRELVDQIRPLMVGYEQRHELRAVGGLASIFGPSRNAG